MEETQNAKKNDDRAANRYGNALRAAKALIYRLPVAWRIAIPALVAVVVFILIAILHKDMKERIKFATDSSLNVLILVAIVVQAVVYFRQRDIMKQQWEAMQGQLDTLERQLAQNQQAIEVAKANAQVAQEALRAGHRAYVGIKTDPKLKLKLNEFPEIEVYFVNTGITPAHVVEFRYKFSSDKEGFGKSFIDYKGVKKDFFIFAGTPKTIPCVWNQQRIDNEWLQQIKDRSSTIYFTGRLAYEDVWGVSDSFKTDDVIRFKYFSLGADELRENYKGDQDYAWAEPVVELDGTEEVVSGDEWEPEEPPDYESYDPYDF
jgi:hypothetical protein